MVRFRFLSRFVALTLLGSALATASAAAADEWVPPPPDNLTISSQHIYPEVDGYLDTVTWDIVDLPAGTVTVQGLIEQDLGTGYVTMFEQSGPGPYTWDGLDLAGNLPEEWALDVYVYGFDAEGKKLFGGHSYLLLQHGRIGPAATKVSTRAAKYSSARAGRCSRVSTPSSHRWKGSVGLNSAVRCSRKSGRAGTAQVTHRLKLPEALAYQSVRIRAFGGAGRGRPHSRARLQVRDAGAGWGPSVQLKKRVRWQPWLVVPVSAIDGRTLVWRTRATNGARYDIKSFQVVVNYTHLP
ncbi:MAG: hypothetical protein WAW88_04680 [Nocardioides sp.]